MNNGNSVVIKPSIGTYIVPSIFYLLLAPLLITEMPDVEPIIILSIVYLCIMGTVARQRVVILSDRICVQTLLKSTCIDFESITSVADVHLATTRMTATRLRIVYVDKMRGEPSHIDINTKIFKREAHKLLLNRLRGGADLRC